MEKRENRKLVREIGRERVKGMEKGLDKKGGGREEKNKKIEYIKNNYREKTKWKK